MSEPLEFSEVQARVQRHNALAQKYRIQVDALREQAEEDARIWEVPLPQRFLQNLEEEVPQASPEAVQRAALDFSFQCMGVGRRDGHECAGSGRHRDL